MRLNRTTLDALRVFPSTLFARMALILLLGLLAAQALSSWLQWGERAAVVAQTRGQNFSERLADAIRVLESGDPSQRSAAIASLASSGLRVALIDAAEVAPMVPRGQIQAVISQRLGSEHEVRSFGGGAGGGLGMRHGNPGAMMSPTGMDARNFDVRLRDGQWVRISALNDAAPPALPANLVANLLLTLAIVSAVLLLAVRLATQPLQRLASAADTLGRDLDAPPLAETGPAETRRAAQAFNRMQARIKGLVGERARALAAVSHDLRTPLTRLRLRAELVDDEPLRAQMVADLEAMAAMIDATLDYLRGLEDSEVTRPIDINALLQSLAEDAAVVGKSVTVDGQALRPYSGRLSALRRAVQNLIDNAIKYGQRAQVRISDEGSALLLIVEDDGPGVPASELGRIGQPYYRPDTSRSRATGGVGLGLSIVKAIALMHGGELILANRAQGGLSATLRLPRS